MFDINQASEGSVQINYQKVGIFDNVKISEVVLEETSKAAVPYMRLKTIGADGALGTSPKMFLSTDVKQGKKTSGWGVTARNIIDLIKATHNVEEDAAKAMIAQIPDANALITKISAILVGKPFRAKFKGRVTEKGTTIAELGQVESMRVETTKMSFNVLRDITPYSGPVSTTVDSEDLHVSNDPLPF